MLCCFIKSSSSLLSCTVRTSGNLAPLALQVANAFEYGPFPPTLKLGSNLVSLAFAAVSKV